jgi:alanine dehydrogenase
MIIGVPKEIKNHEYRVSVVPSGVKTLVGHGHRVLIQKSSGEGSGISDEEYSAAGAVMVPTAEAIYKGSELIVKVKEPLPQEYPLLNEGQILFTYLHLAPDPGLTKALLSRKIIGIAYETVQEDNGVLPLLTPMSEIAGKLSIQIGAHYLEKENGGSGVMLGGVPGVHPANVAIIGGGTVGLNAAKIARGMGARVKLLDISLDRLRYLDDILDGSVTLLASNSDNIEDAVADADLIVGGVLVPGARAN